jgi:hypothetical protein
MTVRAAILRALRLCWLPSLVIALGGCFRYVPVEQTAPPIGNDVRVELTRVGFAELPEIPSYPGPELTGIIVRAETDGLLLRVPVPVRVDGMVREMIDQDVAIPSRSIVAIERRELDRTRTGMSVAAGLATLGAVFLGFKAGGNDTPEIPTPPGEEEAGSRLRSPIFHISLPLGVR